MNVKDDLAQVLSDITNNRAQLAKQITDQSAAFEVQLAAGQDQLRRFDTLIAATQVLLDSEAIQEATAKQMAANAAAGTPDTPSGPSGVITPLVGVPSSAAAAEVDLGVAADAGGGANLSAH
jgi:hypothetical protein